jgi:DNA-binding NarL/FixJ family response regulator
MKARLIIADDHAVLRQGLRDLVARTPDLEIVAEAADGAEAERLARTMPADLLLLDVALPVRRGVQVLESLRRDGIRLPVLLFSMYPAAQYADYARRAGAQGFVSKSVDSAELMAAIRRVVDGGTVFPRRERTSRRSESAADPFAALSRRESEVMQGLLKGESLQHIAAAIGIGPKSVSTYRRRLLDKVGVRSNAELATLAARHGYV